MHQPREECAVVAVDGTLEGAWETHLGFHLEGTWEN
eukprot:CAMPEP_0179014448 /NCGR_PEP_ID=MMETSP0796-20121207/2259_1 /TAXON_ID=73915 /ORGANISM="Pyrodinium bahamense, Strain pbaha01" /LENGTH=35 /DNA_ID= /DNA_START= /DNA_END= /DNA_ORIENTATION=